MTEATKLEPLPWFPFEVAGYLKDTMRLTTESHGAYLLLMLDYYATCQPCPDDDDILAAVAKLPVEVWKAKHRKVLEPFFSVRDGKWFHNRIEREMQEAMLKHSSAVARASAGGRARWGNGPAKPATGKATGKARAVPKASAELAETMRAAKSNAQAELQAKPEQSPSNAHKQEQLNSLSASVLAVKKDNSGDNSPPSSQVEESPPMDDGGLGAPIDPKFWPCPNHITMCKVDGADDETIAAEVKKFILYHQEKGSWSNDWDASFGMWWQRWKEHQAKQKPKGAPRIEVNAKAHEPTETEWRNYLGRWKSDSFWPRAAGPDPSTGRCRAPIALMNELGIDPETGLSRPVVPRKAPAT